MPVASSSKYVGPASLKGELTTQPRFSAGCQPFGPESKRLSSRWETKRSASPQPPRPVLWKYMLCPSGVRFGATSIPGELMLRPRCCGVPHGAPMLSRCETQMSSMPNPPGRSELMYRLRPSLEIAGCCSFAVVLITGPRLRGLDQSDQGQQRGDSLNQFHLTPPMLICFPVNETGAVAASSPRCDSGPALPLAPPTATGSAAGAELSRPPPCSVHPSSDALRWARCPSVHCHRPPPSRG